MVVAAGGGGEWQGGSTTGLSGFPGGAVGTRVRALVREDATCHRATKPVRHKYRACALEPASHNYRAHEPQLLSPCATTTEPVL